jgi:alpha-galactosidase
MNALPVAWVAAAALAALGPARAASGQVPPNAPATLLARDHGVQLVYGGRTILAGVLESRERAPELRTLVDTAGGIVTQVVKWTARDHGPVILTATVRASAEAFPCEVEPRENGLRVVRNSVGLSASLLNRAVYDRRDDWVLSVDSPAQVTVTPVVSGDSTVFRVEASGGEVALRFRPRYYQRHRGLAAFRPWTYRVWDRSVAGWTSWFAFLDSVTEVDIRRTADVMAATLAPWGYAYLQIDDGYERQPIGVPEHWLRANDKFPSGLAALARDIADRGLAPGIWTNVSFHDRAFALAHPAYFVTDAEGQPVFGNWVGFVMDGSNPATLDDLVRPVYDSLAREGWRYFKVDALRHLRYEGYNSWADVFARRGLDRVAVYRGFVQAIRDAIGRQVFMLACWGIRPELAGIVDAVRVGTDGFGYGGFAEYNSYNNVVWRNDPDHIQIAAPDGYRATTLASLTGSVLMLTDKPEVYRTARVEAARRAAPVPFTVPEQVYDVDPSRSDRIGEADVSVSGSGPRPFDADQRLEVPLYLLDVDRPFERWTVLARTGGADDPIRFTDLGLAGDRRYLVFEFWTQRLIGAFQGSFVPGPVDRRFLVQDYCIREWAGHPQLVATNRHVSCGVPDLVDVRWSGDTLSGVSDLVGGDTYELFLSEPAGYRFVAATVGDGAQVIGTARTGAPATGPDGFRAGGALRTVRLRAARSARVAWRVVWRPRR